MKSSRTINISSASVIKIILILLAFFFIYLIRDIVLIVFVSVIIAAALNGPVNWLQERKVPRILGVTFIYLLVFIILGASLSFIIPVLAQQIGQIASYLPIYAEKIGLSVQYLWGRFGPNFQNVLEQIGSKLTDAASSLFATTIQVFGGLVSAFIILFVSAYLSVQEKGIKTFFMSLIPTDRQSNIANLVEKVERKIGGWLRGQLLVMVIVASLVFVGLYFLGVKYALTLALIAGILEVVPYIGPFISAIPAVILAFIQSPTLAILVLLLYVVVQQLEGYLITPQVMKRAVGLNPIVIIIVMMVGFKLAGIMGLILSIPLTAAIVEVLRTYKKNPEIGK